MTELATQVEKSFLLQMGMEKNCSIPDHVLLDGNFKVIPRNCPPVVKQLSCSSTSQNNKIQDPRVKGVCVNANCNYVEKATISI